MHSWLSRHRKLVISFLVAGFMFVLLFGAQAWLYVNFLLGNDTLVRLEASTDSLSLVHGESKSVVFEAGVTANPFCKATCTSLFEDLGRDEIIEENSFEVYAGNPFRREYPIVSPPFGTGTELYRYTLRCRGVATWICRTDESEETERTKLVFVNYTLSPSERAQQNRLRASINESMQDIAAHAPNMSRAIGFVDAVSKTGIKTGLDANATSVHITYDDIAHLAGEVSASWRTKDLSPLGEKSAQLASRVRSWAAEVSRLERAATRLVNREAHVLDEMEVAKEIVRRVAVNESVDNATLQATQQLSREFAKGQADIQKQSTLAAREAISRDLVDQLNTSAQKVATELVQKALFRDVELTVFMQTLCDLGGPCAPRGSRFNISRASSATNVTMGASCADTQIIRAQGSLLNQSLDARVRVENYPPADVFFERNISAMVSNARTNALLSLRKEIIPNASNSALLETYVDGLLLQQGIIPVETYAQFNLTPILLQTAVRDSPIPCLEINVFIPAIISWNLSPTPVNVSPIVLSLEDAPPECCIRGVCAPCCVDSCEGNYPVLFLHGHAVNKDVSAEYSLEGFNAIQGMLDDEGFVNAGTMTLSTAPVTTQMQRFNVSFTVRGSYYFDVFKDPDTSILVQAKQEGIDTYAIRLRDLITTVLETTGKPKLRIVAFSMGGVVSRRYLQLFGEDRVDRLIMVGTPNKGVVGTVADYCTLLGNEIECRDLDAKSLLMNKLNSAKPPSLPVVNIIGRGCDMEGSDGDGAVLVANAKLPYAKNFLVDGVCESAFSPLHLELRDVSKYPEVYDFIWQSLSTQ